MSNSLFSNIHAIPNKPWILLLYGFGQDAKVYEPLICSLKDRYNLAVLNLPYSEFMPEFNIDFLKQAFTDFFNQYHIEDLISISYSIGSRINLCLLEIFPEKFKKIILIAPDGIKVSFWNKLSTQYKLGRSLFKKIMTHETFLPSIVNWIYKLNLISRPLYVFAKWHVKDLDSRLRLYNCWIKTRHLQPNLRELSLLDSKFEFDIISFWGKKDEVIPLKFSKTLQKAFRNIQINYVNKGHMLLDNDLIKDIAALL